MKQGLRVEELGIMPLTALELASVDGGDTVNTSYHNGESQLDWSRYEAVYDGVVNFCAGFNAFFAK